MDEVEDVVGVVLSDGHLISNEIISFEQQDRPAHPIIAKQYKNIHISKLAKTLHSKISPQIPLPLQKLIQPFGGLSKVILMLKQKPTNQLLHLQLIIRNNRKILFVQFGISSENGLF